MMTVTRYWECISNKTETAQHTYKNTQHLFLTMVVVPRKWMIKDKKNKLSLCLKN